MQARNHDKLIEEVRRYIKLLYDVNHITFRNVLQSHLFRFNKQLQKNASNPAIKSIYFPPSFLPVDGLDLTRDILQLTHTKTVSLPIENFADLSSSIVDSLPFATLIPMLDLQLLIIDINHTEDLDDKFDTLFETIHKSNTIYSLTLNHVDKITNSASWTFFAGITALPITALSFGKSDLNNWSDSQWQDFLQAMRLSKTIRKVDVSGCEINETRLEELNKLLTKKNSLMTLVAGSIAKALANNMLLFTEKDLSEILPEPCLDRIQQEKEILFLRKSN